MESPTRRVYGRQTDGSEISLRRCPGCEAPRHPVQFLDEAGIPGALCSVCRECGAAHPLRRRGAEAQGAHEETMMGLVKCPECGSETTERGLPIHRARVHGIRGMYHGGDGSDKPLVPARRTDAPLRPSAPAPLPPSAGLTVSDVVARIRQDVADGQTALRVLERLLAQA